MYIITRNTCVAPDNVVRKIALMINPNRMIIITVQSYREIKSRAPTRIHRHVFTPFIRIFVRFDVTRNKLIIVWFVHFFNTVICLSCYITRFVQTVCLERTNIISYKTPTLQFRVRGHSRRDRTGPPSRAKFPNDFLWKTSFLTETRNRTVIDSGTVACIKRGTDFLTGINGMPPNAHKP